jgi:hypothetical protein
MPNLSFNGTFTACPDPEDFQPEPTPERGTFLNGKPVRQGWPGGLLKFPPMPSAGLNELVSRYEANKNAMTSGAIPRTSGYGFRAVSAWWHEPSPTGWDGPIAHGVTQKLTRIGEF